ncbi:MAG: UbiA family prenyltransferase [Bacilli bacterium]|nr:UbiA family prenyltransferase [Bacilli bacterium]
MKKYSSLLRVKHYIKNILIFLPLIFSGHFMSIKLLTVSFIEFLSFSLAASVVYIFNDLLDYESDKKHPIKKKRAIASGAVSKGKAKGILVFLFILTELIQFVLYKSNIFFFGTISFFKCFYSYLYCS